MAMNYNRKWESFIRGRGEEYEIFHDPEENDMDMDMDMAMAKSSEEVASMEESSLKASGNHEMAIFGAESYFGSYNRNTTEDQHGLSLHQFQAGCSSNTAIVSSGSSTTSIGNSATCSRMSMSSSSCSNLCSSISNSTDSSGITSSRSISSSSSMSSSNSSCSNSSSINRTIINGSCSSSTSSTISNSSTSQRSSTNSSSGSEGMEEMRMGASKKPCNAQSRPQSSTFLSFFARFNLIHSSHRHQNTANTTSPQPQQIQTKPAYHYYTNAQMLPPIGKPPTISSHTRRTSSSSSCHPNRSSSSSSHPNRSSSSSSLSSSSSHPNRANPAHYTNRTSSSALISDPGSTTNHKYYSCNSKDQKMSNKREYFERDMHTPPSYVENSSEKSIEDFTSSLYYHSLDLNYKAILSNPSSSSSLSPSPSSYSITGANSTNNTNDHKMRNKGEYERDLYTPQSCYGNSSQMAIIEDSTPSLYYHPLHLSKYILSNSSSSLSSSSSKQKAFSYCERPSHLPPITQLKYTTRKRQIVHLPLEGKEEEEKDGDDGVKKVGGGFIHKHFKSFGLYDLDVSSEGAKSKREEQLGYESDSSSDLFELQVHDQNMDLQKNRTSHI